VGVALLGSIGYFRQACPEAMDDRAFCGMLESLLVGPSRKWQFNVITKQRKSRAHDYRMLMPGESQRTLA
jgi:hypothetical protein